MPQPPEFPPPPERPLGASDEFDFRGALRLAAEHAPFDEFSASGFGSQEKMQELDEFIASVREKPDEAVIDIDLPIAINEVSTDDPVQYPALLRQLWEEILPHEDPAVVEIAIIEDSLYGIRRAAALHAANPKAKGRFGVFIVRVAPPKEGEEEEFVFFATFSPYGKMRKIDIAMMYAGLLEPSPIDLNCIADLGYSSPEDVIKKYTQLESAEEF